MTIAWQATSIFTCWMAFHKGQILMVATWSSLYKQHGIPEINQRNPMASFKVRNGCEAVTENGQWTPLPGPLDCSVIDVTIQTHKFDLQVMLFFLFIWFTRYGCMRPPNSLLLPTKASLITSAEFRTSIVFPSNENWTTGPYSLVQSSRTSCSLLPC